MALSSAMENTTKILFVEALKGECTFEQANFSLVSLLKDSIPSKYAYNYVLLAAWQYLFYVQRYGLSNPNSFRNKIGVLFKRNDAKAGVSFGQNRSISFAALNNVWRFVR